PQRPCPNLRRGSQPSPVQSYVNFWPGSNAGAASGRRVPAHRRSTPVSRSRRPDECRNAGATRDDWLPRAPPTVQTPPLRPSSTPPARARDRLHLSQLHANMTCRLSPRTPVGYVSRMNIKPGHDGAKICRSSELRVTHRRRFALDVDHPIIFGRRRGPRTLETERSARLG